jgi:hypothetical protein
MRSSPFPEVRRGVLMAVACALTYMGMDRLVAPSKLEAPLQALTDWIVITKDADPDQGCRAVAGIIVDGAVAASEPPKDRRTLSPH